MTKYFRILGFVEACSLLLLFFVAMPLKYIAHKPEAVRIVGSAHGALFIAYVISAFLMAKKLKWSPSLLIFACVLSSVPFGPFIFDKKLFPRT